MPRSQKQKNTSAALIMAVLIVCVAVASWFFLQQFGRTEGGYKNVTFTDALLECQAFVKERYGPSLRRLTLDSHSSRWDDRRGEYQLFFTADIGAADAPAGAEIAEFFIACDISGSSGKLRDFDALENKELKPEAQRMNDGGIFGWP